MYIFVNSIGRSGTTFLSEIFKNVTSIPSFHGTEKEIRDLVDSNFLRKNEDINDKNLIKKIELIKKKQINNNYFESSHIFIFGLCNKILIDNTLKPLYVINIIRNPLEVAVSYENRNSYPSNNKCIWRVPINSNLRYIKLNNNINLTIFQENLLDWVDCQLLFENNKNKFDKYYYFEFELINNFIEFYKLFDNFNITYNKNKLKYYLNNNELNKADGIKLVNKETIITHRHIKETYEFIEILKNNNYYFPIIDNYFKKYLYLYDNI